MTVVASEHKVLIVDDEPTWIEIIADALEEDGFVVQSAKALETALDLMSNDRFDVVIADMLLPGDIPETCQEEYEYAGVWLIEEIRKLDPLTNVIVLTGHGTVQLANETFRRGIFSIVEKSRFKDDCFLAVVRDAIADRQERLERIGNPFVPKTGIEPRHFGGRSAELAFFREKLREAREGPYCDHFLILGDWGIGKTTLLREYKKIAQQQGYAASLAQVEAFPVGTLLIDAVQSLVHSIIRNLPVERGRFKNLINFFDSFGIQILGSGFEISRDTAQRRQLSPLYFLADSLQKLWEDLEHSHGLVVILLDDVQHVANVSPILTILKQALSEPVIQQTKLLFGLASKPEEWRDMTSLERHHPVGRFFQSRCVLGRLSDDEIRNTLEQSLAPTGTRFTADVIDNVIKYTRGHPFEIQVLCHNLVEHQIQAEVDLSVWEPSLRKTVDELGSTIFQFLYSQATAAETEVLRIFANSDDPLTIKDVKATLINLESDVSLNGVDNYAKSLVDKKLLLKVARGLYTIPDMMFKAYVRFKAARWI